VPATDLVSFAFENINNYDNQKPLYIDADEPSRSLNASQFSLLVRKLISGLQAAGLQQGDCVALHLANNVRYDKLS